MAGLGRLRRLKVFSIGCYASPSLWSTTAPLIERFLAKAYRYVLETIHSHHKLRFPIPVRDKFKLRLRFLGCLATLGCATTTHQVDYTLFKPDSLAIGAAAEISGYLKYEFENHNLYPPRNWRQDHLDGHCVPIGILTSQRQLSETARRFNGRFVTVTGVVDNMYSEGGMSFAHCRRLGLAISSVRPAD